MPKQRKRRFIDPKKSVTFEVVPRNQVDPLAVDDSAPKNVLVEKRTQRIIETDCHGPKRLANEKRLEEQQKYGIYFDDDYDYLQHLRDVHVVGTMEKIIRIDKSGLQMEVSRGQDADTDKLKDGLNAPIKAEKPQILLPSSVFASHVEERVGHLHKGLGHVGPQPGWDPDVMAALDDDAVQVDGEEDELEDDFVALASGGAAVIEDLGAGDHELTTRKFYFTEGKEETRDVGDEEGEIFTDSDGGDYDDDADCDDGYKGGHNAMPLFVREETRSRFTNYSLSSSVMTRTGGLKSLDEQFEEMFHKEYDECDIGALDGEGIEGRISTESKIVTRLADQYRREVGLEHGITDDSIDEALDEDLKARVLQSLDKKETTEELKLADNDSERAEHEWDCESILSTYSNTYNRPTIIDYSKKNSTVLLSSRGIPLESKGLSKKSLKQLDSDFINSEDYAKSVCSRASHVAAMRPRDESSAEKKARKNQVKQFRRERRTEKKQNKQAFRSEESRQKIQEINVRNNFQGLKLY